MPAPVNIGATINDTARPCPCGSTAFTLEPGAGPHLAALRCARCGHFSRWMGKAEHDARFSEE